MRHIVHASTNDFQIHLSPLKSPLNVGDKLEVILDENPSTGFVWETETKPAGLDLDLDDFISNAVDDDVVGAGGRRRLVYTNTEIKATGVMQLVKRRPFDPAETAGTTTIVFS